MSSDIHAGSSSGAGGARSPGSPASYGGAEVNPRTIGNTEAPPASNRSFFALDPVSSDQDSDGPAPADLESTVRQITGALKDYGRLFDGQAAASGHDSDGIESPSIEGEPANLLEDLDLVERRVRQIKFYLLVGDYAGRLYNCLGMAAKHLHKGWPSKVVSLSESLEREQRIGEGETSQTLRDCVSFLRRDDLDVDFEMAKLAIDAYATRNLLCHSEAGRGSDDDRDNRVTEDCRTLEKFLRDESSTTSDVWDRMLKSFIRFGEWQDEKHGSTRFLDRAPKADEKEDFKQAFDEGVFKDWPKPYFRERGEWKPNTRQGRSRSDPLPYVPRKRKASSPSPDENPRKRRR